MFYDALWDFWHWNIDAIYILQADFIGIGELIGLIHPSETTL